MLHEGQQIAEPLQYAPIPGSAVAKGEKIFRSIAYNGAPLRNSNGNEAAEGRYCFYPHCFLMLYNGVVHGD